jgi:MrcB-like, N-terminal domain
MGIRTALTSLVDDLPTELSLLEAGRRIRQIAEDLALDCPVGYTVKGYAGQGGRTTTPWIGLFDPEINNRPNCGLYAAYIRHPDSKAVSLTLQQGCDGLRESIGTAAARTTAPRSPPARS